MYFPIAKKFKKNFKKKNKLDYNLFVKLTPRKLTNLKMSF